MVLIINPFGKVGTVERTAGLKRGKFGKGL